MLCHTQHAISHTPPDWPARVRDRTGYQYFRSSCIGPLGCLWYQSLSLVCLFLSSCAKFLVKAVHKPPGADMSCLCLRSSEARRREVPSGMIFVAQIDLMNKSRKILIMMISRIFYLHFLLIDMINIYLTIWFFWEMYGYKAPKYLWLTLR